MLAALFCAAPTPGDIGACGQDPTLLDAPLFFAKKRSLDCQRCQECVIRSAACARACDDDSLEQSFPEGCVPLVHDGRVCLHALEASSCESYREFMRDDSPQVPTECNFCPKR